MGQEPKEAALAHETDVRVDKVDVEGEVMRDVAFIPRSSTPRTIEEKPVVTTSEASLPAHIVSKKQACPRQETQRPIYTISSDVVEPIPAQQQNRQPIPPTASPIRAQQLRQKPIPPRNESIDPVCKAMARSIIAGLPRKALEELLLSAAMGNTSVMDKVVEWNMKHPVQEEEATEANNDPRSATRQPNHGSLQVAEYSHHQKPPKTKTSPRKAHNLAPILIDDDDDDRGLSMTGPAIPTNTPAQETPTAQKTTLSLQTAKRRREHPEEHESPPTSPKRPKQSPTIPIPTPPERTAKLERPLSELTAKWTHLPLIDITAYVNRPISVRQAELERARASGRVKPPTNAFLLYRKAFQTRAKEYGLTYMVNQQVVSQICAESWVLEPEEVKGRFAAWARVERDMHELAYSGYGVCPGNVEAVLGNGEGEGVKVCLGGMGSEIRG